MRFTFKAHKPGESSSQSAIGQDVPSDPPLNPQQKRREQVRRAQKTHRERKEAYIASLEAEVVRLRASESRVMKETKTLYAEVRVLKKLLSDHGIEYESYLQETTNQLALLDLEASQLQSSQHQRLGSPNSTFLLSVSQEKKGWGGRRKQIRIERSPPAAGSTSPPFFGNPSPGIFGQSSPPSFGIEQQQMGVVPSNSPGVGPSNFIDDPSQYFGGNSPQSGSASQLNLSQQPTLTRQSTLPVQAGLFSRPGEISQCLGDLDPTVVGMDFVLALESPCLGHIDVPDSSEAPASTGHALTVSACLLHHHPDPAGQRTTSPTQWQVPGTSIERLLELSRTIPLDEGELTPVQAWDLVRRHEQYAFLETTRWERLKVKLMGNIKCHGFGGVIDRGVFEDSVFEAFVIGKVF